MTSGGLTDAERSRTQRQLLLPEFGESTQQRLRDCKVAVIGAGGLGSPVISYLAAAGIGSLTVIDDDVVELSNLHRQILHSVERIGEPKTASAVAAVARLAPECAVTEIRERLTEANAVELLSDIDIIVDGSDSFETRFVVHAAAVTLSVPVVWGAVLRWDAQVTVFWPNPPAAAGVQPVALTDVFADSEQIRRTAGCSTAGVIGAICGQAGSVMALEVIKLATGVGRPLLGRMLILNGLSGESRTVAIGSQGRTDASAEDRAGGRARVDAGNQATVRHSVGDPRPLHEVPLGAVVLDVRRVEERVALAGPPGSHHLPLDEVLALEANPETWPGLFELVTAEHPLVVVCAEGPRSIRAARHLMSCGVDVAGFLDGGIA